MAIINTKRIYPMREETVILPQFTKMDKRFTGYPEFKYMVEIRHKNYNFILHRKDKIESFNQLRDWCVETWGPSIERDDYLYLSGFDVAKHNVKLNPAWCYHAQEHTYKIYLRDEEEMIWAKLKWL